MLTSGRVKRSPEVEAAFKDVETFAPLKYPTGRDRAALCHAAPVIAAYAAELEQESAAMRGQCIRPDEIERVPGLLVKIAELDAALRGIVEIGKRDMTNPKYDGYFEAAEEALFPLVEVCRRDTDGDGNCHVHPKGCPRP